MNRVFIRLDGKPSERLILVALSKDYDCSFSYHEDTGIAAVSGERAKECKHTFLRIVEIAYRNLALAQAKDSFSNVPIKTLSSEYMAGFAAICYSLITGEPFLFRSLTEAHRAGLSAAAKVTL